MKTMIFLKGNPEPVEYPDCFPVIYLSNRSVHVRDSEGGDVVVVPGIKVEKVEYQP